MGAKRMPKHLIDKIYRASRLMDQIVDINIEVERWLEDNKVTTDGFDFTYD